MNNSRQHILPTQPSLASTRSVKTRLPRRSIARRPIHRIANATSAVEEADVVIAGAGIIGLSCALALLTVRPSMSVVLLDRKEPCAGATGAGQGYIWLAHRDPSSPAWALATRSTALWREQLQRGPLKQPDVEWQASGSMLIASTAEEAESLRARETALRQVGVAASFIGADEVAAQEPSLAPGVASGALIVRADAQINGMKTAGEVLAACNAAGASSGRFRTLFHEDCEALTTDAASRRVTGVVTSQRMLYARLGVVIATGAWAGEFLAKQLGQPAWGELFRPRRGLLLEMPPPEGMPKLRRGLMEVGYTKHYTNQDVGTAAAAVASSNVDITFTATASASGSLLVGSSREFSGWDASAQPAVVESIMAHAATFLPALDAYPVSKISARVGLRPFSASGPKIGRIADGLFLAAGHEGSGLTLAPATVELLLEDLLGIESPLSQRVRDAVRPALTER